MWCAVVIVVAMVLLTVNVKGSDVLIGIASLIDGDTIEIYDLRIRLAARKTLLEEACGPHTSIFVNMSGRIVRTYSS
jgi:hypothetical protein